MLIILRWIVFWWYPSVHNSNEAIDEISQKVSLWHSTKGPLWVIKHLKEINLLYKRHLSGVPLKHSSHIIGIRRDGLPKGLPILNSIWTQGTSKNKREFISFVFTVLSISRCFKAWGSPDLSSISTKPKFSLEPFFAEWDQGAKRWLRKNNYELASFRPSTKVESEDLYYSMKAGPNGPATWTSSLDAQGLVNRSPKVLEALRKASPYLANLAESQGAITNKVNHFFRSTRKAGPADLTRKLSMVKDPDGKLRIIAILDYYSQNYLKKIHEHLFTLLQRIPEDRTFTQDPYVHFDGPYYSFDLSSATDRFPAILQKRLLRFLFTADTSESWYDLLTKEPFYVPWDGSFVTYETGQPMGAYSSWASFAISHHLVVKLAGYRLGYEDFSDYILLGDDIVIGGEAVAMEYKKIMTKEIGVDISDYKTLVSNNTYEFAKRLFHKGVEVSAIQVHAFQSTWKSYTLLLQTYRSYLDRGFIPFNFAPAQEVLYSLFISLGIPPRKAKNMYLKIEAVNALYKFLINGDIESVRNLLVQRYPNERHVPLDFDNLSDYINARLSVVFEKMYSSLTEKVSGTIDKVDAKLAPLLDYAPSDPTFDLDCLDLENLLEQDLSGINNEEWPTPSFVTSHPVAISLRNLFQDLANDPRIVTPARNYQAAVAALVLPDPERIGERRKSTLVAFVQAKLAAELLKSCKTIFRDGGPGWMFEAQWYSNRRA